MVELNGPSVSDKGHEKQEEQLLDGNNAMDDIGNGSFVTTDKIAIDSNERIELLGPSVSDKDELKQEEQQLDGDNAIDNIGNGSFVTPDKVE